MFEIPIFEMPFSEMQILATISLTLLGLCMGSFLNVVIFRLPRMLYWQPDADIKPYQINQPLQTDTNQADIKTQFNLCFPASHCPQCLHKLAWFDNFPLFSFLCLKGHCRYCHVQISFRYPFVEFLTACLSLLIFYKFGFSIQTVAGVILTWILIAVSFIDFDHQLIPDHLTLPGIWLGLLFNVFLVFQNPSSAILGAIIGYASLWSIYWIFKGLTGKEGMGYGDFKLIALLGAWLGWQMLPIIVLLSSFLGSVVGITLIVTKKHQKELPIPFGPFLALGGWVTLLWGQDLNTAYLKWIAVY